MLLTLIIGNVAQSTLWHVIACLISQNASQRFPSLLRRLWKAVKFLKGTGK